MINLNTPTIFRGGRVHDDELRTGTPAPYPGGESQGHFAPWQPRTGSTLAGMTAWRDQAHRDASDFQDTWPLDDDKPRSTSPRLPRSSDALGAARGVVLAVSVCLFVYAVAIAVWLWVRS